MKKKRITYGVYGMMEYQALIKIGKATLKVLFTDGSLTAFGQNPAKYTTSDFLVQHAIENSSDFKRGRITVVNSTELDEEVRIERNPAKTSAEAEAKMVDVQADVQTADVQTVNAEASVETPAAEAKTASEAGAETPSPSAEADAAEATAEEKAAEGGTEVEFTDNQEAKDYLAKNFGVKASSLRNREDIKAAGETYGVKITFINEK